MVALTTLQQRAETLHRLHAGNKPLILVNAWDAASARVLEQEGANVIATTSAGIAWSLGYPDGEQMPRGELIAACERICRVVRVPVTADIERGFGRDADEVSALMHALIGLGVVGVNIEDGVAPTTRRLMPPQSTCERIDALRALARKMDVRLFINARTDVYFAAREDDTRPFDEALRRAELYAAAGADGIFVPGMHDLEEIARFTRAVRLPVNVYAGYPGVPAIDALGVAGVRRVSLGCGPLQSALGLVARIASEAFSLGRYDTMARDMPSASYLNGLFAQ
jgi:2-methylisocitrate lyase-like PEP mutase family enzyme